MKEKDKKTPTWLLFLILLVPLLATIFPFAYTGRDGKTAESVFSFTVAEKMEERISNNLPFSSDLRQIALDMQYFSGSREQNGVFLANNRLMENISVVDGQSVERNNTAIQEFVVARLEEDQLPYLMILPTAAGVLRQQVPTYTEPVNQRNFIDNVYNQLTDSIPTIDVYNTLLLNQEKYIYYRTENNLTPIGGYFVYEQLSKRMLGKNPPARNQYSVTYASDSFYGNLFEKAPYRKIEPDVLMKYESLEEPREYLVTQIVAGSRRRFHTLYPGNTVGAERGMELYLGGKADTTTILSTVANSKKLLLLGDEVTLSYLPFLAYSYHEITFLDITIPRTTAGVELSEFDQILIACSAETYMKSPAIADALGLL